MKTLPIIESAEFVSFVRPLIAANDVHALIGSLTQRWTATQIASLMASADADARKVSALCLALVGRKCALEPLRRALQDADPCVHQMAEHAMWSIWFRAGTESANCHLVRGAMALEKRDFEEASRHFNKAIDLDPDFAEPYNQRAIAHYLQENYAESIVDCRQTIDRMPCHFGAWAGMGHCQAHLGNACKAIDCYSHALQINPRLDGIRQAIQQLRCPS